MQITSNNIYFTSRIPKKVIFEPGTYSPPWTAREQSYGSSGALINNFTTSVINGSQQTDLKKHAAYETMTNFYAKKRSKK